MKVFVVDSHAIYRRGLVSSLEIVERVERVDEADDAPQAREHTALPDADIVILDSSMPGGRGLLAWLAESHDAHVIVCTSDCDEESVIDVIEAGAVGYLRKETLTQDVLQAAIHAAGGGAAIVAPDMLAAIVRGGATEPEAGQPRFPTQRLTDREQRVLGLIAQGHPTREVAEELCYSERTVKNVLHDVVTKLNVRSRSQAVAHAVRDGLI
ncbi:MAG: response regulator transcription factor [Solirubrobacterales bacterium]|nr:response regulator transcription factor [Solirubrobacterales bacterium]